MNKANTFIFMGVSGTGKSVVGEEVARQLNLKFIDGDDLHPKANITKMKNGIPLNDNDRLPWLERINDAAFSLEQKNERGIIVCSALKKYYRDLIRNGNQNLIFLFLKGEYDIILERMKNRNGHFMKEKMLMSQFNTLEIPTAEETDIITININTNLDSVVQQCKNAILQF